MRCRQAIFFFSDFCTKKRGMTIESVLIGTTLALFAIWFVAKALKSVYRPIPNGNPIALVDDVEWKTGDIVLYHCNPYINITIGGEWSHVGVVVVGKSGMPRIFEITGTDHYCTVKPLRKELDDYLAKKDAVLAFRRLDPPPSEAKVRAHVVASLKKRTHYEHVYWRAFYQRVFGAFFPLYVSGKDRLSPKFVGMLCPRRRTVSRELGQCNGPCTHWKCCPWTSGTTRPSRCRGKRGTRGAPHLPSNAFMNP